MKAKYRQSDLAFAISLDDAESKQATLRAALHLFVINGVENTTIRMIAKEAGYSNPVIFKFFPDKAALVRYLFEACYSYIYGQLRFALKDGAPLDENVSSYVKTFVRLMERDLEALIFVQENLRSLWPHSRLRNQSLLRLISESLLPSHKGHRSPSDHSVKLKVAAVIGTCAQIGRLAYFGELKYGSSDFERELSSLLMKILNG